uniref:Transmembrane protein n=1 Tax=Panagrolaimus superbus TaxID=310955 RepID=A0A914YQI2_9BILA
MMLHKSLLLVFFCYIFVFISALPSSKEILKQDEHESSKSVTSSSTSPPPFSHPPVANLPIVPQVVYHNQQLNTLPRVKRAVIKFDHRKHHENIYSISSGERGIRYIE